MSVLIAALFACCGNSHQSGTADAFLAAEKKSGAAPETPAVLIAVQPLGAVDSSLVKFMEAEIESFYGFEAEVLPQLPLPAMAWYAPRSRYRADSLLIWLDGHRPARFRYIAGITEKDISCTSPPYPDWGIFGYGYQPGGACVVSTFRLKRGAGNLLLRERLAKVALHELGHNFGLPHCPSPGCMMADAGGTITTVDNEKKELCAGCRGKLEAFFPR